MSSTMTWLGAIATVAVLVFYEVALALAQRRHPQRLARTAHATLRQEWFEAVPPRPFAGERAAAMTRSGRTGFAAATQHY